MGHDTTEACMIVTLEMDFTLFIHVHDPVRASFHVVANFAVVGTV